MTDTEIVIACLLLLSMTGNMWLAAMLDDARRKIRFRQAMCALWESAYKELRRESHRRCPRTGRLLPKGK